MVVPVYKVEQYLEECLLSLRFQSYPDLEIIVVDDGSPDRSAEIAKAHARRDPRVRLVRRANGGLSAARNTGLAVARGEFLTFVDSDDVVNLEAYATVLAALRESGSDFAVSHYDRIDKGRHPAAAPWIRKAHAVRRLGCTLDDFPEIMVNAVAWSKVYRRSFWDAAGLSFPVGVLYEDQPVSSEAFAKARTFDVLPEVSVSWRVRHDRSSISQQSWSMQNLRGQVEATNSSLAALDATGKTAAGQARALQLLSNNMSHFSRHVLQGDPEFTALLRSALKDLVDRVPQESYIREVRAQDKVLNQLIIEGRLSDAEAFLRSYGLSNGRFPTSRTPDGVRVELPVEHGVPEHCLLLADRQLDLVARVLRMRWEGPGSVVVEGWAYIRNLDLCDYPPSVEIDLVGPAGTRVPVEVRTRSERRLDTAAPHWFCDYRNGGFVATLDTASLPDDPAVWSFEVSVTAAGIRRTGPISEASVGGTATLAPTTVTESGRCLALRRDGDGRLTLAVFGATARATGHHVQGSHLEVTFTALGAQRVTVGGSSPGSRELASAVPEHTPDGRWAVRLDLGRIPQDRPAEDRRLFLWVHSGSDEPVRLLAEPDCEPWPGLPPSGTGWLVTRAPSAELELTDRACVATDYGLTDDELTLVVMAGAEEQLRPLLCCGDDEIAGTAEQRPDGRTLLRFPLTRTLWGHPGLTLPRGRYAVTVGSRWSPEPLPVLPSAALLDRLPLDHAGPRIRATVELHPGAARGLGLQIKEPLADDERGPRNQRRLREEARVERADSDSVFFRSLYGEVANCNGLGVHQELVRRTSTLRLYWSIRDHSVPVPTGGVGVIEGSRSWHEAIARSRYHMVNVHQLDWFVKPRNQVIIETMHGYPYKVMGHEWWAKGNFPASQVQNYDRRAREWDYFVSPATYATPLLEAAFLAPAGATPTILEIGYPRNDVLQSPDAEKIREQVRAELGIRPGQRVVMYAPTFRDYLSTDDMTANRVDFLNYRTAARQLGDGYVFLARGHPFNARAKDTVASTSSVIDVTTYPDINDLILASDVAILDYSSLRFDYVVTDKPMIFLVPDLAQYNRARGGILEFAPTAPGPHVRNTKQVVGLLRDLPKLAREYAVARATFRSRYVDLDDGHAAERLVDAVFVPRGDAPRR